MSFLEPNPRPPVEGRPSNHVAILGVQGFLMGLSMVVVGLRMFVRRTILKTFGWDDWVILISALFSVAVFGCFVGVVKNGGGHYTTDIGVPTEYENLQHWQHTLLVVNITGVSVVKISLSLALLRYLHSRPYQIFLKVLIAFIVVFTISTEAPLVFQCWPERYIWAIDQPPGVCIPYDQFIVVANINAAINIITDAVLVLLPIPTIITLKVNVVTKASLISVLLIGFAATGAAIVRAVAANVPVTNSDTWKLEFYVWNAVELNLGIVAASLPTLRPLFSGWIESATSRMRTGSSSHSLSRSGALPVTGGGGRSHLSNIGGGGGGKKHSRASKHGYQRQRDDRAGAGYAMDSARDWPSSTKCDSPVISGRSRIVQGLQSNSSEEEILASPSRVKGGITKYTEVVVERD